MLRLISKCSSRKLHTGLIFLFLTCLKSADARSAWAQLYALPDFCFTCLCSLFVLTLVVTDMTYLNNNMYRLVQRPQPSTSVYVFGTNYYFEVSIHTAGRVYRFSRYYAHGQWFVQSWTVHRKLIKQKHRDWNKYKEKSVLRSLSWYFSSRRAITRHKILRYSS